MKKEIIEKKVREICTYYSEFNEGTAGYSLSEGQFQKLFVLIEDALSQQRKELIKEIKKIISKNTPRSIEYDIFDAIDSLKNEGDK